MISRTPRIAAATVAVALMMVGCSDGGADLETLPDPVPETAPDDPAPTAPPAVTPTVPSDEESGGDSTTPSTAAPTAPPVTVPPPTESPTTPPPPPLAALILRDEGLGAADFGDDPDEVVAYVTSLLGSPTADTGWVAADAVALCPGQEYRGVEWGVLRVGFGDVSPSGTDRRHFTSWNYGVEGSLGEEPQGVISAAGVGLGTRVDELQAAYPEVQIYEGEEGLFPPSYFVNESFSGFLSGTGPGDVITVMFGGLRCGG